MQIAGFGMARDLTDDSCYVIEGAKLPVKWTPPEVSFKIDLGHCCTYYVYMYMVKQKNIPTQFIVTEGSQAEYLS